MAKHGFARGALLHTPARVLRGWLVCGSGAATVLMSWSGNSYVDCAEAAAALISWRRFVVVFFAGQVVIRSHVHAYVRVGPVWLPHGFT